MKNKIRLGKEGKFFSILNYGCHFYFFNKFVQRAVLGEPDVPLERIAVRKKSINNTKTS